MNRKVINVELPTSSVDNAIKQLTNIRKSIKMINEDFIIESLEWVMEKAKKYHELRTYNFPNTANINNDWKIKKVFGKKNEMGYKLINNNELVAYVEFGTGIVGEMQPHKQANNVNYEYDMNNHKLDGWTFYNDEFNLYFIDFIGYEGQSFLYDAFWDYFYKDKWKEIYQKNYDKYMKYIK